MDMNREELWRELTMLPPEAQRQVMDFIAFLHTRYAPVRSDGKSKHPDLADEEFVGMWRDRQDMLDSTDYVRNLRKREWATPS